MWTTSSGILLYVVVVVVIIIVVFLWHFLPELVLFYLEIVMRSFDENLR